MKNTIIISIISIIAITTLGGVVAADESKSPLDKAYPAKKITTVKQQISDILRMKFDGQKLAIDRGHWDRVLKKEEDPKKKVQNKRPQRGRMVFGNQINIQGNVIVMGGGMGGGGALSKLFHRLRTAAGGRGMSSSRNMNVSSMGFNGGGLNVRLSEGQDVFEAAIQEETSPGLTLNVAQRGEELSVMIIAPEPGSVLIIRQKSTGQFSVKEMIGEDARTFKSDNFLKFCSEHEKYTNDHLMPLLKHVGVNIPIGAAGDPRTIAAVIRVLRFMQDEKGAAEAEKHIGMLNSESHEDREAATKALRGNFFEYYPILVKARDGGGLEPEVKARLDSVFDNSREQMELVGAVYPLNRHKDPVFIAGLLEKCKDEDKKVIIATLKKLTGKDFGDDAAAWKKHVTSDNSNSK